MTAPTLYATLKFMNDLDNQVALQRNLDSVVEALNNLVSQPAHPQHQSSLATALQAFTEATAKLSSAITPAQMTLITEMGGNEFFDSALGDRIRTSIEKNAMTPAVARDFAQDIATRRTAFMEIVRGTMNGLQKLNIKQAQLPPGSADLAFLVPREIFKNHLDALAKELAFFNRLLQQINEGATGSTEPIPVGTLSSSIPMIGLDPGLKVVELLATIIVKFLEAWEKIGKIRKMRNEMADMGITGPPVEHLTKTIKTTIDEVVEESTEIVLVSYSGDAGRRNELKNGLSRDTRRLFGQIERGLTVEFHVNPKSDGTEDQKKMLDRVAQVSRQLKFPEPAREPMLLESGELLEDDEPAGEVIMKRTTRKTTKKQTTIEEVPGEGKQN
jgi:hypothetical protein